jgi:carbon-monoxide dehydrogenase small subunit
MATQIVRMTVNGSEVEGLVEPRRLLADFLREDLELRGTHLGCEQGVCGACTILFNGEPARSCLLFAVQASGAEMMTVEGLAPNGSLHPIQAAFRDHHALQCGFCTPGFLLTSLYLLRTQREIGDEDAVREALSGNLCRCTGYQNIVNAVLEAAARLREAEGTAMGGSK